MSARFVEVVGMDVEVKVELPGRSHFSALAKK
jgi:hypothetical protein